MRRFLLVLACAAFLVPALPAAAAPSPGSLVKIASSSAVYWYGTDGKRHAFPTESVYQSWFADFSGVVTVSASEMAAIPLGKNVTYRPGTRLVKITTDPHVYAVEPSGSLRWVPTEDVAKKLYGSAWAQRVSDLADSFFFDYSIGAALDGLSYPEGSVLRSPDGAFFLVSGGERHRLSGSAASALGRFAVTADSGLLATSVEGAGMSSAAVPFGEATVSYPATPTFSFAAPSVSYFGTGAGVTVASLRLSTDREATVRKITVRLDARDDAAAGRSPDDDLGDLVYGNGIRANLSNLRLVDEGGVERFAARQLALDESKDESQPLTWTGEWRVAAKSAPVLRLVADVNLGLPDGEVFSATLVTASTEVYDAAGARLSFLPASGPVSGSLVNASPQVSISVPEVSTASAVRGTRGAEFGRFSLRVGSSDVHLTSFTVQGYLDSEGDGSYMSGGDADGGVEVRVRDEAPRLSLYADGKLVGGPVDVGFDGRVTFSGMSHALAAGQTVQLKLVGDIPAGVQVANRPDYVAFDVTNPSTSVVAVTSSGQAVAVALPTPNFAPGAASPRRYLAVKARGSLRVKWTAAGGDILAGSSVTSGTLSFTAKEDSYRVTNLVFRSEGGTTPESFVDMRLDYPGPDGQVKSANARFLGLDVNFPNLDLTVPAGQTVTATLVASAITRAAGARYGEQLTMGLHPSSTAQFQSVTNGDKFTEKDWGATSLDDFYLETAYANPLTVRYSTFTVTKDGGPSGLVERSTNTEVLRFAVTAQGANQVRVRKLVLKVTPGDAGKDGLDSLERWAQAIGAGNDANPVIDLVRVNGPSFSDQLVVGEDTTTSLRYYIYHRGARRSDFTEVTSSGGDYAQFEYDFGQGSEYTLSPGETAHFIVRLDTSVFWMVASSYQNAEFPLAVSLTGYGDLTWTDAVGYNYDVRAATGGDLPISSSLKVRKP